MASNMITGDLTQRIEQLLGDRQRHEDALAEIDQTLQRVAAALGTTAAALGRPADAPERKKPGPKRGSGRRGRRGSYPTTAEDSVLGYIREHKNPTTAEIKQHWLQENRGGTVDNVLSKLFREKKVKREPLEGQRGSRYLMV